MRVLVTGATGQVGNAIARALADRGDEVRALVRDPARAAAVLPPGVAAVRGDITDPESVEAAVEGCELVFNAAGLPEQWLRDEGMFERVNAYGTEAVVRAAVRAGVRRVVHTSTIDVFHAEPGGRFDESLVADYPKGTAYERSKQHAEELALAARGDLELVIVNPAAVYGRKPYGSASLDESLILPVTRRALPALVPGGLGVVHADGVGRGHLLAADRGRDGERYILCDRHITLRELARTAVRVAGHGWVPPVLPVPIARSLASISETLARAGLPPLVSRGQLHFLLWNAAPESGKAQDELGWEPTPLEDGLAIALEAAGG